MLPAAHLRTLRRKIRKSVNVATLEQPNLKYVIPGDPANSYLVRKLLGAASITGGRMPLGGPYLDDATTAQVAAWIAAGALNH